MISLLYLTAKIYMYTKKTGRIHTNVLTTATPGRVIGGFNFLFKD